VWGDVYHSRSIGSWVGGWIDRQIDKKYGIHRYPPSASHSRAYIPPECSSRPMRPRGWRRGGSRRDWGSISSLVAGFSDPVRGYALLRRKGREGKVARDLKATSSQRFDSPSSKSAERFPHRNGRLYHFLTLGGGGLEGSGGESGGR
jgi:hypothetical protein